MRRPTKFLLVVLLVEAVVLGTFCYWKISNSAAPQPRLEAIESITAEGLAAKVEACVTGEQFQELGILYLGNGFFPEANAALNRASELLPQSADVAFDYGYAMSNTDATEASNVQFAKAIELKSEKTTEAMYFIGRNHLRDENSEKAEEAFRKAAKIPRAKYEAAKLLVQKGEIDNALDFLNDIGMTQPNRIETALLLARIAELQGDEKEWMSFNIETMNKWKPIDDPLDEEAERIYQVNKLIGYINQRVELTKSVRERRVVGARAKLEKMQDVEFSDAIQIFLIEHAFKTSRFAKVIELIDERNERLGVSSKWLSKKGECYLNTGDYDQAIVCWNVGAKLNTDEGGRSCSENLSRFYLSVKPDQIKSIPFQIAGLGALVFESIQYRQFKDGVGFAKKLVKLGPESSECHYLLGATLLGSGQLDEAVEAFQRSAELDPTHGRALRQLEALGK